MASLRELKRRIRSTQNTKQIMRAMQLVSATKFKRAQSQLMQGREMMSFLDGLLHRVLAAVENVDHELCVSHGGPDALLIVTSDTGLCGSYNANLLALAEKELRKEAVPEKLLYLGRKGFGILTKRGYSCEEAFTDLAGRPDVAAINAIGDSLLRKFLDGTYGSVSILSAEFVSSAVSRPKLRQWLPAAITASTENREPGTDYIFEPSVEAVLQDLLPRWALARFQLSILEAFTSEHGARMVAMKNATDNADTLIKELTHTRNQIRQTSITREISEIVGTAEALN